MNENIDLISQNPFFFQKPAHNEWFFILAWIVFNNRPNKIYPFTIKLV